MILAKWNVTSHMVVLTLNISLATNLQFCNRFFQFIVGADGLTGLTYEHSPAEGQPIAVLTDFIIKYM